MRFIHMLIRPHKKILTGNIVVALLLAGPLSLAGTQNTFAASNENEFSNIENLNFTESGQTFTLVYDEGETDFNIEYNGDKMLLTTTTGNKIHTFEYNEGDSFAIMDGEKVELSFEEFVDPTKVNDDSQPIFSAYKADDYTPVYMSTAKINFDKMVTDVSDIVTVIGGVIAIGGIIGAAITKKQIASVIGNWAGAVGFATLIVSKTFSGKITYDQYRTKGLVDTGYGTKYHAIRNDNVRVIASVAGFSMNEQLRGTGDWYFNTKPY